ncbi:hypothetical protein ACFVGM_09170 [Kitasatospora purpeofusca]|uniref:hypothetical protein n=1 Tax=Kitasatospora purpeofusca TaxID=67352 RepID=UPI0036BABB0A
MATLIDRRTSVGRRGCAPAQRGGGLVSRVIDGVLHVENVWGPVEQFPIAEFEILEEAPPFASGAGYVQDEESGRWFLAARIQVSAGMWGAFAWPADEDGATTGAN